MYGATKADPAMFRILILLLLWIRYAQQVEGFGVTNKLSLIPAPPPAPPPPPPSLSFEDLFHGPKFFLDDVRRTLLDSFTSNGANFKDQVSTLLPKVSKEINTISSWLQDLLPPFELPVPAEDFIVSALPTDLRNLGILVPDYARDSSHEIIRVLEELQSSLMQSFPGLDQLLKLNINTSPTLSPAFTLFLSTIVTYVLVVNALPLPQASSPSRPYPMNKYDANTARIYFDRRPFLVTLRALTIASRSLQFGFSLLLDQIQEKVEDNELQRGRELAILLTRLGPTFIKVGQSLSIRTDLLSPAYVRGLETLQDQVPAFDTLIAKRILEAEWGKPITTVLSDDLSAKPVAAASLGQVYKARLRESNEEVAIKVQRPDIMEQIALDMYLIREIGGLVKRVTKLNTDVIGTVDAWGVGFVDELDYIQEAANGEKFSELILGTPLRDVVFAPMVVKEFTTRTVLVSSWVNGDRLDRSDAKDVSVICSIAMNTYLTMLLEFGLLRT